MIVGDLKRCLDVFIVYHFSIMVFKFHSWTHSLAFLDFVTVGGKSCN